MWEGLGYLGKVRKYFLSLGRNSINKISQFILSFLNGGLTKKDYITFFFHFLIYCSSILYPHSVVSSLF